MKNLIARFAANESGATAIEYGLIAAGIAVAIITLTGEIGDELVNIYTDVRDELRNIQ